MYLSKLELNPRSREARRDLASPYELHRTLAHAFPTPAGQDYRATHGVLFRLEPSYAGQSSVVLVQSHTAPDWTLLPADYTRQAAEYKKTHFTPLSGQTLGFRLVANPTKKMSRPDKRQGNRVPLFDAGGGDEGTPALQWLRRKAALSGFEVLHVLSEGFLLGSTSTTTQDTKSSLPLYGVRFNGLLRVTNSEQLTAAISQGIGSAKAFGFGLLSLAQPTR